MENVTQSAGELNTNNRLKAKLLYWQGLRVARICEIIDERPPTVHSWKRRDNWDKASVIDKVNTSLESRLVELIAKENKEGKDFKEIDLLMRQVERLARVNKYQETGKEKDLNPNIERRNEAPKRAPKRNDIGEEGLKLLTDNFHASLFGHQKHWFRAGEKHRIRDILKSRQIGATWYFAREAIIDAYHTGKNKIFLSASKAQAHIFKHYIVQFVKEATGVELKGDPLVLPNGATLYFLGTNAKTAQGYHGDVYLDEFFWIQGFKEFRKVASGMAMHKKWRQTYFSTPSSLTHEAYPFWSGEQYNKNRTKDQRITIDLSHENLKEGLLCGDGHWRQIVTVMDALAGGCDLFDLDQLHLEYSIDEFNNLLMCQFMDDSLAVFPLAAMNRCMVDSWVTWRDYKPFAERPLAFNEVWLGYDPSGASENGDGAGLILISPGNSTQPHRIIHAERLKGKDYEAQAEYILKLTKCFNITYMGFDVTGIGEAVAQLVEKKFPFITRFSYSPEVKARMVLQAQHIIDKGRLQFDAGRSDIAQSFMAIRRTITNSGTKITYKARRSEATGHSELAWATMHALSNEPLSGPNDSTNSPILEIYS